MGWFFLQSLTETEQKQPLKIDEIFLDNKNKIRT